MMHQAIESAFSVEGSGPPLFLIHGIGASRHSWDGLTSHLKQDFRCISYDLRGHGKSPLPAPPYSLDDLVADLERLRSELGIERAHFAGHSLGGMIGPAYARQYSN
ncbi:MAG: alpha/beta fold hydrolase, partial [Gammaproteobacteria bacterium]